MRRRIRGMMMSGKQFSLDSRMDLVQSNLVRGAETVLPLMREASLESECGSQIASDSGKSIQPS